MSQEALTGTMTDGQGASSQVTLGEVTFDPVDEKDFRLSVEGTSGVGKSNTLAVFLEDLADVAIPTLIVERLGALSPVRLVDEDIVVVGAREEEGVDLAVALDDLDQIGSWVLDRGMKVLLDISTYADYEDDKSRVHLAAANALRSLNDRAHEKYRSGDRTKSLLVVDEAHILAPKDSAPEPELDDWVKRCRGELIKASTEGGNKGISIITAYQRRAFLHNGVIQLAADFVAHRPGDEDIDRTADALRCSTEALASLGTGEILARGTAITDGDLVGPTAVRKRESPDPREETFELPETPDELASVLEEIQDEVEAERERRSERQSELEKLREENERLRAEIDDLEEELQDSERIARALERIQEGGNGGDSAELAEELERLEDQKTELADRVDTLESEKETLEFQLAEKDDTIQSLEEQYENDLAALNSLRSGLQMLGLGGDGDVTAGVSEERVERIVDQRVQEVDTGGGSSRDIEDVHDAILAEFQEDAVERVLDTVEDMSDRQRRLLTYIEAKGSREESRKQWATNALGREIGSDDYDDMDELADAGFVRMDGSKVYPATRSLVEDELEAYDAPEEAVDETYQEVLARLS